MRRTWPVLVLAVLLSGGAGVLWDVAYRWTESGIDPRMMPLLRSAALAVMVLAGVCWPAWGFAWYLTRRGARERAVEERVAEVTAGYRQREARLLQIIEKLAGQPTGPMPLLRAVGGEEEARPGRRR